jgi:DNA-binding transcriptional LysR family regulator
LTSLEEAVGTSLVIRTPRGVSFTAAGRGFVDHAERMEAEYFAASDALGGADAHVTGVVRLATPEAFGSYLIAPSAHRLYQKYPALRLDLMPGSQLVRLANRDADLAIMLNRPPRGPVVARKLIDYTVGLYASHDYLDRYGPIETVQNLARHPFAWYIEDMIDIPELLFLKEVSQEVHPVFRSTSIVAQHAAVAGGMGIGLLHAFAAQRDARLVRVLNKEVEITRSYWLVIHEKLKALPRVRAVVDLIDEIVEDNRKTF